jgi:2'-5' RNA ligase
MSEGGSGKRLFAGARISVAAANALAGAAETLARRAKDADVDIRWVAPASYHVTLRFLGWTRAEAVGAVRDALGEAVAGTGVAAGGAAPARFKTARLGAFSSLDRATVVWAGVEEPGPAGKGPLAELAAAIEAACVRLGYPVERRPFVPHVTLGRLREARAVREVVLPLAEQMFGETRLDAVLLFESETKSTGSVYRELHRFELGGAAKAPISAPQRQTPPVEQGARTADTADTDDGWPRGAGPHFDHDAS